MREYEIFKRNKWGASPTGVIIQATTKSGAVYEARKRLGRGSWEAHESNTELRAEQAKQGAEVRAKLAAQPIPTIVVAPDGSLRYVGVRYADEEETP